MHDNKSLCCTISVTLNAAFDKNNFHVLWFMWVFYKIIHETESSLNKYGVELCILGEVMEFYWDHVF